jgi:hypothetical protein
MPVLLNTTAYDDYSFYNINQINATLQGATAAEILGWANSWEDTPDVATVTKLYENVEKKVRARGKGTGTIAFEGHVRYPVLTSILSMADPTMREGVYGYGQPSLHKPFLLTARVENEDGDVVLVAYPQAIVREPAARTISPNAEEVAAMALTFAYMPDDYGYGRYEAKLGDMTFADDAAQAAFVQSWLTEWDIELVDPVTP